LASAVLNKTAKKSICFFDSLRQFSFFIHNKNFIMEAKLIGTDRVIWEKCFSQQECVKIPFDGTKCVGISACVRIIEDSGSYSIELQIFGQRIRYSLANICYPVYSIGIATLEVCTSNLSIISGKIVSVTIVVKGCVHAKIGPIDINKCWDLFNQPVNFFNISEGKAAIHGDEVVIGYNDIAYLE
jgi:hypothetical protein